MIKWLSVLFMMFFVVSTTVQAKTLTYVDPTYNFTIFFPDDWRQQAVDDHLQFEIRPLHHDHNAVCEMRVIDDKRLAIYPREKYSKAAPLFLNQDYWAQNVLPNYKDASVLDYSEQAGLGLGFGSSLQFQYTDDISNDLMQAVSIASLHENALYRFTCAAHVTIFPQIQPLFAQMMTRIKIGHRDHYPPIGKIQATQE